MVIIVHLVAGVFYSFSVVVFALKCFFFYTNLVLLCFPAVFEISIIYMMQKKTKIKLTWELLNPKQVCVKQVVHLTLHVHECIFYKYYNSYLFLDFHSPCKAKSLLPVSIIQ